MSQPIPLTKSLLQLLCTSAISGYGLYLSYQNITRLQQYEEQSKKAAEWSNTAAHRLHKTRTTQTSGTISLLVSFITPLALMTTESPSILISASVANTIMLLFTRTHMANFWNEKNQTRIPFVQKFNDAVRGSEQVVKILGALTASWVVAGLGWGAMSRGWI